MQSAPSHLTGGSCILFPVGAHGRKAADAAIAGQERGLETSVQSRLTGASLCNSKRVALRRESFRWVLAGWALWILALAPLAARGDSVSATALFRYRNDSYTQDNWGGPIAAGVIIPGGSGAGAGVNTGFQTGPGGLEYDVSATVLQDYGVFHAQASVYAQRLGPYSFEYFQAFAEGIFRETLTIAAPAGVANGSIGQLMLGWDITGSQGSGLNSDSRLSISAQTSANLPNSSSFVVGIDGTGYYQLLDSIPFIFGNRSRAAKAKKQGKNECLVIVS